MRSDRTARKESAAAAAHKQVIELADFFEQFLRRRALARDHVRMVKGRNDRHAAFGRDLPGESVAVGFVLVVQDDLGTVAARSLDLDRRCIHGHHDHGPDAQHASGEGHCLGVIA